MERRWQALDRGMEGHHGVSHALAGGVEIEAAPETAVLVKELGDPGGIGSGARGGETAVLGMEHVATEGVDGRFAEDDVGAREGRKGEEAEIFAGTGSQATPGHGTGAAQFGADRLAGDIAEEEDGVGPCVGVEVARLDQGVDQGVRQGALIDEVTANGVELAWGGTG